MAAGTLKRKLSYQSRGETAVDEYGGTSGSEFEERFDEYTRIVPRLGGETVLAARQTGTNLLAATVRASPQTKQITTDWRAFDEVENIYYNIRSAVLNEKRTFVEMLFEQGVPT